MGNLNKDVAIAEYMYRLNDALDWCLTISQALHYLLITFLTPFMRFILI